MKCLSLYQPWASLIACCEKRFETRSWRTGYRGPLLIAASKSFPPQCRELCLMEPFASALDILDAWSIDAALIRGFVLAVGQLADCVAVESLDGRIDQYERAYGDFTPGRWAWRLDDVRRLRSPLPFRGAQGLYDVPDELVVPMLVGCKNASSGSAMQAAWHANAA